MVLTLLTCCNSKALIHNQNSYSNIRIKASEMFQLQHLSNEFVTIIMPKQLLSSPFILSNLKIDTFRYNDRKFKNDTPTKLPSNLKLKKNPDQLIDKSDDNGDNFNLSTNANINVTEQTSTDNF